MNHAQNTPGYPVRIQVVFTLRDGVSRAWMVTELGGCGALVAMPFETAKAFVEKDQADEFLGPVPLNFGRALPLANLEKEAGPSGSCGCHKPAARNPQGRLAGEVAVGEPLFAVAEGEDLRVACAGEECCEEEIGEGTPKGIRFDRYAVAEDGGYELRDSVQAELPKRLVEIYGKRAPACLPWVRISRDPARFRQCLARAKALGPMDNPESIYKLVGEHLASEDQEVFLVILLDSQLHVRAVSELARGSRDRTAVSIPDTLRVALVEGSMAFVVVHNHPSGVLKPSEADEQLTEALRDAAKKVQLNLMDHVIVGANGYYSFYQHRNVLK
jgi:DNA repair protein RadC